MKVKVDADLCVGHGRCYTVAPSVYEADAEGFNSGRDAVIDVAPGEEDAARVGAKSCPERAITVIEDHSN
jgi:ferredoxin